MHPFGGTQICPRCDKAVYAAEQVMGPGRKLYHKPCLACTICNKRLDSFTLLEHDQKPYCKSCHVNNFGTRDLRQANLPYRARSITPPPADTDTPLSTSPSPARGVGSAGAPWLRPTHTLTTSPTSPSFPRTSDSDEERDTFPAPERTSPFPTARPPALDPVYTGTPTNTGRPGLGGIPRTVPLSPTRSGTGRHYTRGSIDADVDAGAGAQSVKPLVQTATGTRYGAALGGSVGVQLTGNGGSPRKWGAAITPSCPRCGKSVYFAEQVKAVGKTFHKGCLRCTECSTLLDSSRLRDHDGEPICMRCYGKLHGPQGGGYALLGKAGG